MRLLICLFAIALYGCGGGGPTCTAGLGLVLGSSGGCNTSNTSSGSTTVSAPAGAVNSTPSAVAPVAVTPAIQNVTIGAIVKLDGTSSTTTSASGLTFKWILVSKPLGSAAVVTGDTLAISSFQADLPGEYVASLTVSDGILTSIPVQVRVTATVVNAAPVANAGQNQTVLPNTSVLLDGTLSADANNDPLKFRWQIMQKPANSRALLSSTVSPKPILDVDLPGTYSINLVVNDGIIDSQISTVNVIVVTSKPPPLANAGVGQNVITGSQVTLDGSASSDPSGSSLSYVWTMLVKPAGSKAVLAPITDARPKFVADVSGLYVFNLTVSNFTTGSSPSAVTVFADNVNLPPIANAGSPQNVVTGARVILDGSASFDPEGKPLSYQWNLLSVPFGSTTALSSLSSVKPTFSADLPGIYVATLIVNDGNSNSTLAVNSVTAASGNIAPIANAGSNLLVPVGANVTLDGTTSSDANNDPLTYKWILLSKPVGSVAALSSSISAKPTFKADLPGTYVASLVVNDGLLNSLATSVAVTANAIPVAIAGADQSVKLGVVVKLDGSKSFDLNNDALKFQWQLLSKPFNSTVTLSSLTDPMPTFTPDKTGDYVATLKVNDGNIDSTIVAVKITVSAN